MLIHNVHKVKNPQINCDPWTEGVYQGSYTLKEVCLAQNSNFLPEMEIPKQKFSKNNSMEIIKFSFVIFL